MDNCRAQQQRWDSIRWPGQCRVTLCEVQMPDYMTSYKTIVHALMAQVKVECRQARSGRQPMLACGVTGS